MTERGISHVLLDYCNYASLVLYLCCSTQHQGNHESSRLCIPSSRASDRPDSRDFEGGPIATRNLVMPKHGCRRSLGDVGYLSYASVYPYQKKIRLRAWDI